MSCIRHRNIVRCYGGAMARNENEQDCMVLEYVAGGTLDDYVHKTRKKSRMTITEVLSTAIHVSDALSYLHPHVVHRDLKPCNIMLDEKGVLKVTDFGISTMKHAAYLTRNPMVGTPAYTAPEVYRSEPVRLTPLLCLLGSACTFVEGNN